jgi:hypothetical protein
VLSIEANLQQTALSRSVVLRHEILGHRKRWQKIELGEISIHKIDTSDQLVDYLTKPVNQEIITKLWKLIMGWSQNASCGFSLLN